MDAYALNDGPSGQASGLQALTRFYRRFAEKCADLRVGFDVVLPGGAVQRLGTGNSEFRIVLHNKRALRALGTLNQREVAEAYFSGDLDVEGDMLRALRLRDVLGDRDLLLTIWRYLQPLLFGQISLNKRVIASHYDRDPEFFLLFLDPEMPIYTHGVYERDDEPLAVAAKRKFDYCYAKLRLKPGDRVLEIGPGWGAWLKYASDRGVHCTGISISNYSIEYLNKIAKSGGYQWNLIFSDLLEFKTDQKFDAIVMMGVIEHLPLYRPVLTKFMSILKPGGRIYLDGGSGQSRREHSSVIVKHIYPGNHSLLVLQEFLQEMANTPLRVHEIINDRHSYYLTFVQWARNLECNRQTMIQHFGKMDYRRFLLFLWGFAHAMETGVTDCYRMVIDYPGD
jgi:cyclopropane-fatty-acyl-phospholipid synthase